MTEKEPMRKAYGEALVELGKENENVVVLDADLSCSTQTKIFAKEFPERFFNLGIAEQNLAVTAAGFASAGKIPFMSTFSVFAPGRCYDQIRVSISYSNLPVKIVSTHGGITTGEDGHTHQALEDIGMLRALPNFKIMVPADALEVKQMVKASVDYKGPVYIRVSRMSVPRIYPDDYKFKDSADVLRKGKDVSIIACGLMVKNALDAAELLEKENISAEVVNMHVISPIDEKQILKSAKTCGAIVTAEEHSVTTGLGAAVAEILVENNPVPMERVGVKNRFGQSGKPDELMKEYNLTAEDIVKAAKKVVGRKK
ncbi:MAG: transketolase family protein [archaeon]